MCHSRVGSVSAEGLKSEEFVFTAGEQEFFEEKGFDDPQRCKECRERRKSERRNRGFRRY
ncbi:cytochrome C551 [Methanosarcinales archaeon ex4484_138]|nr:MAG: cytochrome C551 [Methanosarcinales archaeon ex4484_138]